MTADLRLTVAYNLSHPHADPAAIKVIVMGLRLRAIDLGFLRVGDLICHTSKEDVVTSEYGERFLLPDLDVIPAVPTAACYFTAALADTDLIEFGLAYYSCAVDVEGEAVPFGCPTWLWTGATKTRDLKTLTRLLHYASELGIEAFVSFAGLSLVYSPDGAGKVKVVQEWDADT
ncbi:MAG: hypothetical protein U0736_03800 [Gemmataceae bacterium]